MARKTPSFETLKLLYTLSGNECAYHDCDHPIFNDDGLYIAQLCHIHAAMPGGPRYKPEQSDDERRLPENLMFMCHRHHKESDSLSDTELKALKAEHESKFTEVGRSVTKGMIRQVLFESKYFWSQLEKKKYAFRI